MATNNSTIFVSITTVWKVYFWAANRTLPIGGNKKETHRNKHTHTDTRTHKQTDEDGASRRPLFFFPLTYFETSVVADRARTPTVGSTAFEDHHVAYCGPTLRESFASQISLHLHEALLHRAQKFQEPHRQDCPSPQWPCWRVWRHLRSKAAPRSWMDPPMCEKVMEALGSTYKD